VASFWLPAVVIGVKAVKASFSKDDSVTLAVFGGFILAVTLPKLALVTCEKRHFLNHLFLNAIT
jgi:hypothetical protein